MKKLILIFISALSLSCCTNNTGTTNDDKTAVKIELAGNSYVTNGQDSRLSISDDGLSGWYSSQSVISTYFYLQESGEFTMSLNAKGSSKIKVSCNNTSYDVELNSTTTSEVEVGKFYATTTGYIKVDLQGITASQSDTFGEIQSINIYGIDDITYVHDFSTYWGRRGPSVHMSYAFPSDKDIQWFYNEVTIPNEGEVMSSYYMAAGFSEGYFGMQYNSDIERRILFSVWSPYDTQDPNEIPEEYKIKLLRQGADVYIGEFGNEGSGGQSYLVYDWKAGNTYKFLMGVEPDGNGNTVYTAYFYATDESKWRLIASFMRPKTDTWYTGAHSFLENFNPEQGYLERSVNFSNQWACTTDGEWIELHDGTFTHDATASAGVRLDYQGGINSEGSFYLKMGGFFNESTTGYTKFTSTYTATQPVIDFDALELL